MPNSKISNLPAASSVGGSDITVIVQGGADKKATLSQISGLGASDHKVLNSAADTTAGYLSDKVKTAVGSAITIVTHAPGSNENLEVDIDVANSITESGGLLQLVNDSGSPGNDKVYGTDGSGVKGWQAGGGGGSAGGANTNIQFNNAGAFGGIANFVWNSGASTLSFGNGGMPQFFELDGVNAIIHIGQGALVAVRICETTGATLGFFNSFGVPQQAANQAMTDSTGGTPSTTLAAVAGTGDDANINNNLASLNARLAEIRTLLRAYPDNP